MNFFSDVAIAFGLYLLALFISKFWERPIVWILESFIFPELKKAFERLKDPALWSGFDKELRENPLKPLGEAIEDTRRSLGLDQSNKLVWWFVRRRFFKQFSIDQYRKSTAVK